MAVLESLHVIGGLTAVLVVEACHVLAERDGRPICDASGHWPVLSFDALWKHGFILVDEHVVHSVAK